MNELIVKIRHTNATAPFSAGDVKHAMESLFGLNTDFSVEEIKRQKRKGSRKSVSLPVKCFLFDAKDPSVSAVSINLSLSGVKILCKEFLPPKQNLKLNIYLTEGIAEITTQVIWCDKNDDSHKYYAGLRFIQVNESSRNALETFISQYLS
ncbi:MAG: PilZ domain-containing protein [Candidatus Omnitrophota bacterium]